MSYSNATFYIDLENGNDAARTALTSCTASNPSGTITRINKTAHGLVTGAVCDLTAFSAWLNAAWKITVVDADNFDLDGAVWETTADNSGTVTPRGGSSKADAWKTTTSGATSSRVAGGDTVRMMASPLPGLVGDATWTQGSRTVTLASAVTANITLCEAAWIASANVTTTTSSTRKEGSLSTSIAIAGAFTTGKCAYLATGTLDLSGYQQVSFWFRTSTNYTASRLSLRLCTDTTGDVSVHTIPITTGVSGIWIATTVDLGTNLNSAIQSIALYQDTNDAAVTILLDNIIACKARSSADALSLTALIGKALNMPWQASTAYSTNVARRPTTPNRTGYYYTATTGGTSGSSEPAWPILIGSTVVDGSVTWTCTAVEETWLGIKSIDGTTVTLDQTVNDAPTVGRGYHGTTETVSTAKREPIQVTATVGNSQTLTPGSGGSVITYSGGWDRSNMTSLVDETWIDGQAGLGGGWAFNSSGRAKLFNAGVCRFDTGVQCSGGVMISLFGVHANNNQNNGFAGSAIRAKFAAIVASNNAVYGQYSGTEATIEAEYRACAMYSNANHGWWTLYTAIVRMVDFVTKNNGGRGLYHQVDTDGLFYGVVSANNVTVSAGSDNTFFQNSLFSDGEPILDSRSNAGFLRFQDYGQVPGDHRYVFSYGRITSATDQRHTASGISWKFLPTTTANNSDHPLTLPIAQIACASGVAVNVTVWTRRDSTNIQGRLRVRNGMVAGVIEASVSCAPTINTWVQSSTLTFTPTAAGVVEIVFDVWDGVGTTNAFWIDDLSVA